MAATVVFAAVLSPVVRCACCGAVRCLDVGGAACLATVMPELQRG